MNHVNRVLYGERAIKAAAWGFAPTCYFQHRDGKPAEGVSLGKARVLARTMPERIYCVLREER